MYLIKVLRIGGWPDGVVVGFACSTSVALGSRGQIDQFVLNDLQRVEVIK